jgi:hypothetical protein
LRFFEQEYDLEELGWSMAEKGYFNEEPLLTITDPADESRRIVIEGNRRLATLSADVWKFVGGQELAGGRCSCQALGSAR